MFSSSVLVINFVQHRARRNPKSEHTHEAIAARYRSLNDEAIAALKSLPARNIATDKFIPIVRQSQRPPVLYADFLAGKFGKAILQSVKMVEVRVRTAAKLTDKEFGGDLIQVAFN